jgi:hypothetical protein
MVFKPADFIELSVFLPSRIQSMMGKSNAHHLKMLDNHLVDMLIAMVLCRGLRIVIKEEDVHDKKNP